MDEETVRAYEAQLEELRFEIEDGELTLERWPDVGACYVRVKVEDERIWVVARPTQGANFQFFALNPAAAFDLVNAILAQGERAGWYSGVAEGGHPTHKTVQ